jgi:predicted transcriptional regulator
MPPTQRRPMGSLETEVMEVLWSTDRACTPAQVRDAMGTDLAYTTVMTILTRLWHKGLATREKRGRAFAYRAASSEADLLARRMREQLARSTDRVSTMLRFVEGLDPGEADQLRALLEEADG